MTPSRAVARLRDALVGRPLALAPELVARYPELTEARWRAGGLPLRVGGWCLGRAAVAGITLWRTVFLADPERASPALLLHELAHVRQFARQRVFPLLYCWESLRRGYTRNRFELQADAFARASTAAAAARPPSAQRPD
ncbi:hypothetical protein tb265_28340 [Gemmatimonadetes bacterium T265]|nr:hypothetical protein tb265_28340 [Gemmatimonadetes bacterium T265]